jgi:hypothetical protein
MIISINGKDYDCEAYRKRSRLQNGKISFCHVIDFGNKKQFIFDNGSEVTLDNWDEKSEWFYAIKTNQE